MTFINKIRKYEWNPFFSIFRLLDQEQLQHDMTLTEFHKSRETLLDKQKEYKDITDEEEINDIKLKGLIQEQKSLDR